LKFIYLTNTRHKVPTNVKHCLSLTCVKKPVFSKRGLLRWKVPARLYCDLLTVEVPASLSLFLKSEKIPALLYVGKEPEYRSFCDLRPVKRTSAQVSNHRRACTQALLLYQIPHVCNNCQFETMCECSICLQSQKTAS
jgi:hypothetical protein